MQSSWEVELDALISSTYETAEPSITATRSSTTTAEPNALAMLQELLSLLASQILQRKSLDYVGECLNDLATDDLLSNESVVHLSAVLK